MNWIFLSAAERHLPGSLTRNRYPYFSIRDPCCIRRRRKALVFPGLVRLGIVVNRAFQVPITSTITDDRGVFERPDTKDRIFLMTESESPSHAGVDMLINRRFFRNQIPIDALAQEPSQCQSATAPRVRYVPGWLHLQSPQ